MGKRGPRTKRRPSHYERRAHKVTGDEGPHRRRARLISNLVIVAAVFTVANILAAAKGVLPYDFFAFLIVQWAIVGVLGVLELFIYVWNSRVPVYREAFWMILVYTAVASWVVTAVAW